MDHTCIKRSGAGPTLSDATLGGVDGAPAKDTVHSLRATGSDRLAGLTINIPAPSRLPKVVRDADSTREPTNEPEAPTTRR
jgi:hypothetical protein